MSTWCQLGVDTVLGQGGTDIRTDGLTDGLSDQPSRVLEFHMLYGTKKVPLTLMSFMRSEVESFHPPGRKEVNSEIS